MNRDTSRRPWLRYSLRGLLLVTTIACFGLAILANKVHRQRDAVEAVASSGGQVAFDYQFRHDTKEAQPPGPAWLRRLVGDELFRLPQHVELRGDKITDEFLAEHLAGLDGVEFLLIDSQQVTDAGLAAVAQQDSIDMLSLDCPRVTDAGLAELAKMKQLAALRVAAPQVTDAGMEHVAQLTSLKQLNLHCPRVTPAGIRRLAPLKELVGLISLRDPGNEMISVLLRSRLDVDLVDVPLIDAVEFLADAYEVNIDVAADIPTDRRTKSVNCVGQGMSLREALDRILRPADLDYYVAKVAIQVAPKGEAAHHRAGERALRETLPNLGSMEVDW